MSQQAFENYRDRLVDKYRKGTEHTPRTPFENLLNSLKPSESISIVHEPKRSVGMNGRPDFKVEKNGLILGHVETKPIGSDLDAIVDGDGTEREVEQLQRYLATSRNLVLTNYTEFILFKGGAEIDRADLCRPGDFELDGDSIEATTRLFESYFLSEPETVCDPERLSKLLAERTRTFDELLAEFLNSSTDNEFRRRLVGDRGLYSLYRDTLMEDLKRSEFIDTYVQTITFGLLLARLNSESPLRMDEIVSNVPTSVGILSDLFKTLEIDSIPGSVSWIVDELLFVLNNTDVESVNERLSFDETYNYEDPYVYFYENFLREFDNELKIRGGVYYTPIPVVWFIIRGLADVLEHEFGLAGLGDSNVTALDFATGTGTFLLESFKQALDGADPGLAEKLIEEHLLENFYGFENMIAPYTLCHLKLAQFLEGRGYDMDDDERFNVYLTDTLDNARHEEWWTFPDISSEGRDANEVKLETPVLAIMGNPPYSIHSENRSRWIQNLIEDYKEGLNEKKVNLDDDYIKFIRYAQWKIDENDEGGVIGVVTNNSFVDGITHRGMRRELFDSFDEVYVLNLHGNKSKGDPDENVFDIRSVGISISFFVKYPEPVGQTEVYYASTLDEGLHDREAKYEFLLENDLASVDWEQLAPSEPDYWFVEKDLDLEAEYRDGWSVEDIFEVGGSGVKTDRDDLFVDFDREELADRMETLLSGDFDDEFRETYRVEDTSSYPIEDRIEDARYDESNLRSYHYRPFDHRSVYYKQGLTSRPASKVMDAFLGAERNLALVAVRQVAERSGFNHVFVSDRVTDLRITTSNRGTAYLYPLYLDERPDTQTKLTGAGASSARRLFGPRDRKVNFTDEFVAFLAETYDFEISPEEVFCYVYGVLSSHAYREIYQEFLKVDYPHVRFVEDEATFRAVARLGRRLVELHTLAERPSRDDACVVTGEASFAVRDVRYDPDSETLAIDGDRAFENLPEAAWEFDLGGYQVLDKWLSEREGRELSLADVQRFQRVARVLAETIDVMAELDRAFDP